MRSFGNYWIPIFHSKGNLSSIGDNGIAPPGPKALPRIGRPKSASNNHNKAANIPSSNQEPIFRPSNLETSPIKVVHPKNHTYKGPRKW